MIDKVKNDIASIKGKNVDIVVNNIRNKKDELSGVVDEMYKRVFIVRCSDSLTRSFNYSDVLTGIVEIKRK